MITYPYNYRFTKRPPQTQFSGPEKKHARLLKILPPTLITLGSLLVANVLWPLINYQVFTAPSLKKDDWVSPVAKEYLGSGTIARDLTGLSKSNPSAVLGMDTDYTKITSWFPTARYAQNNHTGLTYILDIPTVNIENAQVVIDGQSLDQHLIQFPGTAEPGTYGTTVIFGHSVLRQFYNPSVANPRRYISIFSKIMTLKNSDRIFIEFNGLIYTYEVIDKFEVEPEDVSVLEQRLDTKELKLITCVPEGTYLRRGVVVARLVDKTDVNDTNVLN